MAKDNRLKDLLSPETKLTEYYLIKIGLELVLYNLFGYCCTRRETVSVWVQDYARRAAGSPFKP